MVYHLLPEGEPFSECYGGALSRWTANVLRDDRSAVILTPWSDQTWKFAPKQVHALPMLRCYRQLLRLSRNRISPNLRRFFSALSFRTAFSHVTRDDVIYVHNRPEFVAAIHTAYPRRTFKLVLHMHNSHLLQNPKEFAQCADLTLFCSGFLEREAKQAIGNIPSAVIPNGADSAYFFPSTDRNANGPPKILFVGRLVPDKGVHVLTAAMHILQQRGSNAQAMIVGAAEFGANRETPYVRRLKAAAPTNTVFVPYKTGPALADDFRKSTLFCCPSVFAEPFGMVNIEAMACGLPAVATAVGGVPEVFAEGGALLVPPDQPEKLADALHIVTTDPDVRTRLGREGQLSFQKNFTWDAVRTKYLCALASLAA